MNPLTLGQDRLESIMRKHLEERFGVVVELGTELVTFKQDENKVVAHLKKRVHEGEGITETLDVKYLIGTDGGRSKSTFLSLRRSTNNGKHDRRRTQGIGY